MPTKFFTNTEDNSLLKKFEGTLKHITNLNHFDALVGYFRASGYFKIQNFLKDIPKIRILVGINVDNLTKKYQERGRLYLANPEQTKETFLNEITEDIQQANYTKDIENGFFQFIDDLISGKIEMRAHPSKTIHAKVYIFRPRDYNEYTPCEVITGSSNLTDAGLGANIQSNYEFNVALRDYEDIKFATDEFEKLWEQSVPILKEEAQKIKQNTFLRDNFTPYEIYIKMLIEYFGKRVEYDPYNIDLLLPPKYYRLKYQSDAANQGYSIMMKHNGFILADVVGLGKTIIACMIIKKFIYENGTHTRVLVVVPPAIEKGWRTTVKDFELDLHFSFITLGSLHKITDKKNIFEYNPEDFDLIVIDESHKFRNEYTDMYIKLQEICKTPRKRPAETGDNRKKIILISATPLNNRPQDIENQLYLFQDKRNSTLENIRNLQAYFKPINEKYKKLSKETPLNIKKLKALFQQLRDDLIEQLVIRRTRTDIENNPDYLEDLEKQNIKFPKVKGPFALKYKLNKKLTHLFYDTVSLLTSLDEEGNETDGIGYYRYRAIEFLANKKLAKERYGNVGQISGRLSAIMKTLLIKRLESSFFAFKMSLDRLQKAINNMIEMFENDRIFIAPDLDINKLLEEGYSYDQIEELINKKSIDNPEFEVKNIEYEADNFSDEFLEHLKTDKQYVDDLVERWAEVKNDPKLKEFTDKIKNDFFDENKNISGKLVIFSESKETAELLSQKLSKIPKINRKGILTVSAENRKNIESILLDNFDANLDEEKWKNDYDIVITTEVLAEGINLHRSNMIVNYDTPWNATRLMQRIGRVNRIGSRADNIYVYNFYPSTEGDAQINLINNALRKLQAFHTAFGEDNKIFSKLEEKGEGALFGNKIVKEESEILKYLIELRDFKKKYPKKFIQYKNIKNKARCGRKAQENLQPTIFNTENNQITYPLQNTSLTYLKSENHPGIFCLVTSEMQIIELNFLQAVKIYKANEKEKAIELHKLHHEQTLAAMNFFKSEKNQEDLQNITKRNLSPAENKALTNLNAIIKIAQTEQKKQALKRAMEVIRKGTFASKGLPKKINVFFTANTEMLKEPQKFIDKLFIEILDKLDLSANVENIIKNKNTHFGIINPKIVLTQSFK